MVGPYTDEGNHLYKIQEDHQMTFHTKYECNRHFSFRADDSQKLFPLSLNEKLWHLVAGPYGARVHYLYSFIEHHQIIIHTKT